MQEAKHEGDANYWKTRYVLLEAKHNMLEAKRDELLEALKAFPKESSTRDGLINSLLEWQKTHLEPAIAKATAPEGAI